jgi:hypothetical protein
MAHSSINAVSHIIADPRTPLIERIGAVLGGSILGTIGDDTKSQQEIQHARTLCLEGNPFPLIAKQWPKLLILDEETARYFDGTIGDELNPCLRLDWWQRLAIQAFFDKTITEIFFKGATGTGKGFTASLIACLAFDVNSECKIHVTSVRLDHAKNFLFAEIRKSYESMAFPSYATPASTHIKQSGTKYIEVLQPDTAGNGEAFSGAHSDFTVFFFDESSGVPDHFYNNCLNNCRKVVCLSNPRTKQGFFYNAYSSLEPIHGNRDSTDVVPGRNGQRLLMTVGGMDCANTRFGRLRIPVSPKGGIDIDGKFYDHGTPIPDEDFAKVATLIPNQIDLGRYRAISSGDGVDHPLLIPCYADGIFPKEDPEFQAIFATWLRAHSCDQSIVPVDCFGLDVARSLESDWTYLTSGSRHGIKKQHGMRINNYPDIASEVLRIAEEDYGIDLRNGQHPLCIDFGGGWGAGVGDWLRRCGVWVIEFHPGGRAPLHPQIYINWRTEAYCLFGERLNPAGVFGGRKFTIPNNQELHQDLSAPLKIPTREGTSYKLQSKDEIKRTLGRSPDRGDSAICCFVAICELANWNVIFSEMQQRDAVVLSDDMQEMMKDLHPLQMAFESGESKQYEHDEHDEPEENHQVKHRLDVETSVDHFIDEMIGDYIASDEKDNSDIGWEVDR